MLTIHGRFTYTPLIDVRLLRPAVSRSTIRREAPLSRRRRPSCRVSSFHRGISRRGARARNDTSGRAAKGSPRPLCCGHGHACMSRRPPLVRLDRTGPLVRRTHSRSRDRPVSLSLSNLHADAAYHRCGFVADVPGFPCGAARSRPGHVSSRPVSHAISRRLPGRPISSHIASGPVVPGPLTGGEPPQARHHHRQHVDHGLDLGGRRPPSDGEAERALGRRRVAADGAQDV